MFLQNNTTTTHKMSHEHFPLSSGSEIHKCFHPVVFLITFNEQSTKIQSKCFEKIFVDLLDQVQENSSNCMNNLNAESGQVLRFQQRINVDDLTLCRN